MLTVPPIHMYGQWGCLLCTLYVLWYMYTRHWLLHVSGASPRIWTCDTPSWVGWEDYIVYGGLLTIPPILPISPQTNHGDGQWLQSGKREQLLQLYRSVMLWNSLFTCDKFVIYKLIITILLLAQTPARQTPFHHVSWVRSGHKTRTITCLGHLASITLQKIIRRRMKVIKLAGRYI